MNVSALYRGCVIATIKQGWEGFIWSFCLGSLLLPLFIFVVRTFVELSLSVYLIRDRLYRLKKSPPAAKKQQQKVASKQTSVASSVHNNKVVEAVPAYRHMARDAYRPVDNDVESQLESVDDEIQDQEEDGPEDTTGSSSHTEQPHSPARSVPSVRSAPRSIRSNAPFATAARSDVRPLRSRPDEHTIDVAEDEYDEDEDEYTEEEEDETQDAYHDDMRSVRSASIHSMASGRSPSASIRSTSVRSSIHSSVRGGSIPSHLSSTMRSRR
eukprot:GILJ01015752.1.p1 GENE.GILJ01015752.1~~GILJ01015752.1.p1  ORF type:complete len:269 (-),score=34.58 GILJ01015752.1:77-883(-)